MFMTRGSTASGRGTPGWNQWSGMSQQMGGMKPQMPNFQGFQGFQQASQPATPFGGSQPKFGMQKPSWQAPLGSMRGSLAGGVNARQSPGFGAMRSQAPAPQPYQQQPMAQSPMQQPMATTQAPSQTPAPSAPYQPNQPTYTSGIDIQDVYSPQATAQGQAQLMAMAQQQAMSAGNNYALPGFARSSPGLQSLANRDAAKAIMQGVLNAQNLGIAGRLANSENQLSGQRARFADVFGQLENALSLQNQQGLYGLANQELDVNAMLAQQSSDSNWLTMALQGLQQGWNDQFGWLGNLYSMGLNDANLAQQQNSALLSSLMGLV